MAWRSGRTAFPSISPHARGYFRRARHCRTRTSRARSLLRLGQRRPSHRPEFRQVVLLHPRAHATGELLLFKGDDFPKTDVIQALPNPSHSTVLMISSRFVAFFSPAPLVSSIHADPPRRGLRPPRDSLRSLRGG